jgi:chaperonin GroES
MPLGVQAGDKVLLPEYGGTKVDLGDSKEYHLFKESDILAKIDP